MVINGRWKETSEECCIINVYAPCNLREKVLLWDRISLVVGQREDMNTCIIGNFNSILEEGERMGESGTDSVRDRRKFLEFVEQCKLVDIGLQGRKFMRYQSGGVL